MKTRSKLLVAALGMLVLILDAQNAVSAAMEGVTLCLRTVIPSLFPFFVLSNYIVTEVSSVNLPFGRHLAHLLGIPAGSEGILLSGFLGGYPTGASAVSQAVSNGILTRTEGERMMAFSNNVGPAFLFGLAASVFPKRWMAWALWLIHILSALLVAMVMPGKSNRRVTRTAGSSITFPSALFSGVRTMGIVCGWVVLFRVLIGFLNRWVLWLLPVGSVAIAGVLELTNGCCMLSQITHLGGRFVLCSGLLTFGGLCVGMQTASVAGNLDNRFYFPGKCLQTLLSVSMALVVQNFFTGGEKLPSWTMAMPLMVAIGVILPRVRQKRGSNPGTIHV